MNQQFDGMTQDDLEKFANSIDEQHPLFDEVWSLVLFGGRDPNEVRQMVSDAYNAGAIKSEAKPEYKLWLSEWELRGSETGE